MKKIFSITSITAIVLFTAAAVFAWGRGYHHNYDRGDNNNRGWHQGYSHMGYGYGHRGQGDAERLKYELNLSDSQVEKIIDIDAKFRAKYYKNRNSADKLYSLREQHRKAVENVLTKKQKKQFRDFYRNGPRRGYGNGYCRNSYR